MDKGFLMLVLGISIASILLLYIIIQSATKANAIYRIQYAQLHIIAEMARKSGVEEHKIQEILSWIK